MANARVIKRDEFAKWTKQLPWEALLFREMFRVTQASMVADVGCGNGQHAVMFGKWGLEVLALDPSETLLAEAEMTLAEHAQEIEEAGGRVEFFQGGFGELAEHVPARKMDVIVCADNALPHVKGEDGLHATLADFAASVRPGGLLILHFLNHTRLLQKRVRMIPPVLKETPEGEKIFMRVISYSPDEKEILFEYVTLARGEEGEWATSTRVSRHTALPVDLVVNALTHAGFYVVDTFGNHHGKVFEPLRDEAVIITARRLHHFSGS